EHPHSKNSDRISKTRKSGYRFRPVPHQFDLSPEGLPCRSKAGAGRLKLRFTLNSEIGKSSSSSCSWSSSRIINVLPSRERYKIVAGKIAFSRAWKSHEGLGS